MAYALVLVVFSAAAMLVSPSHSLTCTSQKFTNDKTYTNCVDLPVLDAYLHYTYNATNSSLSVAYVAAPAKPDGWVAWAINPTGQGMVGSQALIAFKSKNSLVVKTYNIKAYGPVEESKLSFDVWDLSAESFADDNMVIFASVKVPEKAEKVNQVWQVGPSVIDGTPGRHEMNDDNLKSMGVLMLGGGAGGLAPSASTTPSSPPPVGGKAGASRISKLSMGSCMGVLVLLGYFIGL